MRWGTLAVALWAFGHLAPREVRYSDLPHAVQRRLAAEGIQAQTFEVYRTGVERGTAERERDGENDHLVFYILQSAEFTNAPRIEPALSAKQYVASGNVPGRAAARIHDFLVSHAESERLSYFRSLLPADGRRAYLEREYSRAMRSLYAKEFEGKSHYYESRGHSTDTQITANYALWNAFSVLRRAEPGAKISRVLIVGPGLDIAPRTDLVDRYRPQSYQPYAVAIMLRQLAFAQTPQIECVDINARVIRFIREFPSRSTRKLEFAAPPGDPEYESWIRSMRPLLKAVPGDIAPAITADKLNIITQRLDARFDLAIATNVLVYFNDAELLLAIANISAMLRPGGYFIHNELRPAIDRDAADCGLTGLQARTIRIGMGSKAPLYDAFAIYRKSAGN